MKSFFSILLCIIGLSLSNCTKPTDPEEITDFAYPPDEMLSYYDFSVGSWWAYKCTNDSTIDTLIVLVSEDASRIRKANDGGGYYLNRRCQYSYVNKNGQLNLGDFTKRSHPIGPIVRGEELEHDRFSLYIASSDDHFNGQYPFHFPFTAFDTFRLQLLILITKYGILWYKVFYTKTPFVYRMHGKIAH